MASLHKHSSGRSPFWFASYQGTDGKFKLRSTKQTDRGKAMQVALEFERASRQAKAGTLTESQCRRVLSDILEKTTGDHIRHTTVETFLKDWLESKVRAKSTGTAVRYGHTVSLFLAHLGERKDRSINAISSRHIQSFLDARLEEKVAPKTALVDVKCLNSAFNAARRQGIIESNPVEAVEMPKVESSEREVFTPAQVRMLLDGAPSTDWRTLIMLGYFLGARLSDCVAMTWDGVDPMYGAIVYRQQKTSKNVVVPIHPELELHLSKLVSTDKPEKYLCPALAEKGSGGKHGLSESFKRIMANAGIDSRPVQGKGIQVFHKLSFHSLRHSFNSALANAGVAQEFRMRLTGHATVSINTKYTHHEIAPLKAAICKIPSLPAAV